MKKLSCLLIAVKRINPVIVKMVELKNTMVTTVLMKKEPKDLQILCPFQSSKLGLAVMNQCNVVRKLRLK